jgi:hypothetical protein
MLDHFNIVKALESLCSGAQWSMNGDTYEGIEWLDQTQTKPTIEEINAEILRQQEEYSNKEYQRLRQKEYPSFADQFDLLYHGGYDAWKSAIESIKNKYPKPQ